MNSKIIPSIDMIDLTTRGFHYGTTMEGALTLKENAFATFTASYDCLTIKYACESESYAEVVVQKIPIGWKHANYGSRDGFFLCPKCGEAVNMVRYMGIYFLCIDCCTSEQKIKYTEKLDAIANLKSSMRIGTVQSSVYL